MGPRRLTITLQVRPAVLASLSPPGSSSWAMPPQRGPTYHNASRPASASLPVQGLGRGMVRRRKRSAIRRPRIKGLRRADQQRICRRSRLAKLCHSGGFGRHFSSKSCHIFCTPSGLPPIVTPNQIKKTINVAREAPERSTKIPCGINLQRTWPSDNPSNSCPGCSGGFAAMRRVPFRHPLTTAGHTIAASARRPAAMAHIKNVAAE